MKKRFVTKNALHPLTIAISLACAVGLQASFALGASTPHQEVLDAVEKQEQPFLDTLETLVNIDSGTGDTEGLSVVEELLTERLEELGADPVDWRLS